MIVMILIGVIKNNCVTEKFEKERMQTTNSILKHSKHSHNKPIPRKVCLKPYVDCTEIQNQIFENLTFSACIIQNRDPDHPTCIKMYVDIIHCADWSDYYFIEDNPRFDFQ